MTPEEVRIIVRESVRETLVSIGVDTADSDAVTRMQKNMAWLNNRVELEERISAKVVVTIAVAAVGGLLSVLVLGFKQLFQGS